MEWIKFSERKPDEHKYWNRHVLCSDGTRIWVDSYFKASPMPNSINQEGFWLMARDTYVPYWAELPELPTIDKETK